MHHFGLAFDVVPLDGAKPVWSIFHPVWQEGRQDGEGLRTRMSGGLEEIQGVCPFPLHGRAQSRRDQGGEETVGVTLCGIW